MNVCELWLREWVDPAVTVEKMTSQLTMAGLEIDALSPVAGAFNKVIVAEVLSTKPHPEASRLTLCEVNAGNDTHLQIVCGAANVRSGLKVALAQTGASLPNGMVIKETKLRGELSQGMLCSLSELGMAEESEGIFELEPDAPVGQDLREYLQLDDYILDVNLTPNRADCFSVIGIAREIAAANEKPLKTVPQVEITPEIDDHIPVQIQNTQPCPRYCGRVIRGIQTHLLTPLWMKERLRRCGIRAIHPVVDVCNYVMLELGQPLHAFDLQKVDTGIIVRFAKQGEPLILLDGQEINLDEKHLVIADKNKVLALAGILGGELSAVEAETTDIFLEAAYFNPLMLAGTARHYGLCTDASQRFERGVDPALPAVALDRATSLLQSIVGGKAGPLIQMEAKEQLPASISIAFDTVKVKQLTGVEIPVRQMQAILENLSMKLTPSTATKFTVHVPSHRFDIRADVDLVEEIVRMYGYDNIQAESRVGLIQAGQINRREQVAHHLSLMLSNRGYNETISYSFVDPALQDILFPEAHKLSLLNPISSELAQMRVSLWPGLIASMVHNQHRQQQSLRLFESGVIFDARETPMVERACIAGLAVGERSSFNWSEKPKPVDFFDLKGDLEVIFESLNLPSPHFIEDKHPALHPGQAARLRINGQHAGWLGVLHPGIADALDINGEVILFELLLDPLTASKPVRYRPLSKYPQIRRDLSFFVDENLSAAAIETAVRNTATPGWLKHFTIFDVYKGKGVPTGQKSLAIALNLQNPDKTLVDAEINAEISAIIKVLIDKFSITLRD